MVAAVLGMIPEGLYLLTTVALALSTMRLSKRKVLLHDMKSIETLARVDVLCVDKTGTITEPEMKVKEVVFEGEDVTERLTDYVLASRTTMRRCRRCRRLFRKMQSKNMPL